LTLLQAVFSGQISRWLLPFVLAYLTYRTGNWAEQQLSTPFRSSCTQFLLSHRYESYLGQLPQFAERAFVRVFDSRHGSWKCIRRSTVFSTCSLLATFVITLFFSPLGLFQFWQGLFKLGLKALLIAVVFWVVGCVLPDYLMLGKTRFVIWVLEKANLNSRRLALTLGFDFVLANYVFLTAFVACQIILVMGYESISGKLPAHSSLLSMIGAGGFVFALLFVIEAAALGLTGSLYFGVPFGNLFWASMIPSVWLWLYILSALFTRFLVTSFPVLRVVTHVLDVQRHPVRSVGVVAALVVFVVAVFCVAFATAFLPELAKPGAPPAFS
jgi:hypothetical protein